MIYENHDIRHLIEVAIHDFSDRHFKAKFKDLPIEMKQALLKVFAKIAQEMAVEL